MPPSQHHLQDIVAITKMKELNRIDERKNRLHPVPTDSMVSSRRRLVAAQTITRQSSAPETTCWPSGDGYTHVTSPV